MQLLQLIESRPEQPCQSTGSAEGFSRERNVKSKAAYLILGKWLALKRKVVRLGT